MSETLPYGGEPPAQAHSPTSVAAAKSIKKSIGPSHRRILEILAWMPWNDDGGWTDEEMQDHLDMGANTQRPRRCELVALGKIKDSGKTRPTRSGRDAVVWVLAS